MTSDGHQTQIRNALATFADVARSCGSEYRVVGSALLAAHRLPFLYDLLNLLYNLYGGVRVLLGRTWEAWE